MDQLDTKREQLDRALDAISLAATAPLLVEHVMTRRPTCIDLDVTAYELVRLFHAQRFRHPLVIDELGRLVGVISDRDVLRCFGTDGSPTREELEEVTARALMSTDVITIEPQALLADAVSAMLAHGINCLPVVDDGKVCGIVTSTDVYLVTERMLRRTAVVQLA
jgi:CBS domain-containing protein